VAQRHLTTEDGWYYFLVGWSTIIGQIFEAEITPAIFDQLARAAEALR
jgi:hypothetical protein